MVRVSCVVTTSATHPDIVDISMTNAVSIGIIILPADPANVCFAIRGIKNSLRPTDRHTEYTQKIS